MGVELERLQVEYDGPVARIWMNRPDLRNAFDGLMITELRRVLFDLRSVDAVRVVVLGGRGPSFCAGADLQWMKAMASFTREENLREAQALADLFFTVYESPKAIVARVHGAALGGGAGLVAASDIPVAALGTQFGFTEVRLGILPAVISPYVIGKIGIDNLYQAQNEKDQAVNGYVEGLRRYWTAFYRVRRLTLFDFVENREIR